MAAIEIRDPGPDDDDRIAELLHLVSPQYPEITGEELRARIKAVPAGIPFQRFVAEQDGVVLGCGDLLQQFWTGTPGSFHGEIAVDPGSQGRGIGTRLYERLMEVAPEHGAERVYGDVEEDKKEARAFAERRGFRETGIVARMSRLDVEEANLDGYRQVEARLKGEGIRITTLAELGADDERVLHAVHDTEMEYSKDVPSSETFALPFEQWLEFIRTFPGVSPDAIFLATDGPAVIGTANLQRQGTNSAFNNGTGVLREYRGRGVARFLKLRQIEWARQNGVRYLYTGNDINNPRMYDINMRLGYQPLPSRVEVVREFQPAAV